MVEPLIGRPIWILIPDFFPGIGGEEVQAKQVSKAYLALGLTVRVVTRRHGYPHSRGLPGSDVVEGIPVTRVYSRGVGKLGALLYMLGSFWLLLRHGRGAIYHAHDIGAVGWLAVIASRLLGGRSIIKLRSGRYGYQKRLSSWLARWQFSRLLHLADRVVVVNREVEQLVKELGVSARQVVLIPNGVDTDYFCPASAEEKLKSRRALELPADKTVVLFVGRLVPVKGLDVLLRAWALLPDTVHAGALLLLVGDGEERGNLLNMTQLLGLQNSVVLLGEQREVKNYYWAADLFVLPSRSEGLSMALNEAMSCGLPFIASNVGGALDVQDEDENGVLFESEDYHELALKLAALVTRRDRWPEMGARAKETVTKYADLDTVVRRLNKLYLELN